MTHWLGTEGTYTGIRSTQPIGEGLSQQQQLWAGQTLVRNKSIIGALKDHTVGLSCC